MFVVERRWWDSRLAVYILAAVLINLPMGVFSAGGFVHGLSEGRGFDGFSCGMFLVNGVFGVPVMILVVIGIVGRTRFELYERQLVIRRRPFPHKDLTVNLVEGLFLEMESQASSKNATQYRLVARVGERVLPLDGWTTRESEVRRVALAVAAAAGVPFAQGGWGGAPLVSATPGSPSQRAHPPAPVPTAPPDPLAARRPVGESGPSEGVGIRCTECGGSFPMQTLAEAVFCPHCGTRQELSSTAHVEARRYRDQARAGIDAAAADRQQVSQWKSWARSIDTVRWVMVGGMLVLFLGVGGAAMAGAAFAPSGTPLAVVPFMICGAVMPVVSFGALAAWLWRRRREAEDGRSSRPLSPRVAGRRGSKVACPHCGAPNALRPGEAVQTCEHCRGALIPSRTAMVRALDAVRFERRRAAIARVREIRARTSRGMQASASVASAMPLLMGFIFAPPVIFIPILLVIAAETLRLRIFAIFGALFVYASAAGIIGFIVMRKRRRKGELRSALDDLAMQFHGEASTRVSDLVRWLDTFWAADYPLGHFLAGPGFGTVTLDAWGYPALLAVNAARHGANRNQETYVEALVAAWVPGVSEGRPVPALEGYAAAMLESLRGLGFEVRVTESGLVASAHEDVVTRLRRTPDALHFLATVTAHLVRLARELGAQPVAPIP